MHELSIAEAILKTVQSATLPYPGARLTRLVLCIGEHAGIDRRSLSFALEAIAPDTVLNGAEIAMISTAGKAVCGACGALQDVEEEVAEDSLPCCSACAAALTRMNSTDMYIQELEIDTVEEA
jgi:hydrogenase nickel incorporation protein HypA/HybF